MDKINNDLHVPLLYDDNHYNDETNNTAQYVEEEEEEEVDDKSRAVWFICSIKVQEEEEEVDIDVDGCDSDIEKNVYVNGDDNKKVTYKVTKNDDSKMKWIWNIVISAILPTLLYFQFYVTYNDISKRNDYETESINYEEDEAMDWKSIQYSIFLFVLTTILYRISIMYDSMNSIDYESNDSDTISYCELMLHLFPDIIINVLLILIVFQQTIAALFLMQVTTILFAFYAMMNSCGCCCFGITGTSPTNGSSCSIRIITTIDEKDDTDDSDMEN